jgi:predicted ATP-binding protein involved in virulence
MIKVITIEGLFGCFNYIIECKNKITVIYGPNGCGKTTILRMLDAIFNNRVQQLCRIEFCTFKFELDNGDYLKIIRKKGSIPKIRSIRRKGNIVERIDSDTFELNFELSMNDELKKYTQNDTILEFLDYAWPVDNVTHNSDYYNAYFSKYLPFDRLSENMWRNRQTDITYDTNEFIEKYYYVILDELPSNLRKQSETPKEVSNFLSAIRVWFVPADRLLETKIEKTNSYGGESVKNDAKVSVYASNIAEKVKQALQDYGAFSQTKDRTFPLRAIRKPGLLSVQQIKNRLKELEAKRLHLINIGILEKDTEVSLDELMSSVTEDSRQTLSLYVKDTEEKLKVLDDFASSLSLFKQILDQKFINKEIVFSKVKGITFKILNSDLELEATNLSSGEQHEIVLLYDLIFKADTNTLILIDEPELSLHIRWQLEFINDLQKIIDRSGFSALIATHSPQIIDDRWDLTSSLDKEDF